MNKQRFDHEHRLNFRLPADLFERLRARAKAEDRSVNAELLHILRDGLTPARDKLEKVAG
jgi:plasmid stability protein